MALKTCCSRMRRAISWVYWPPKSSTTTPPSSDLGLLFSFFTLASVVMMLLSDDEIQHFVRNIDDFADSLAVELHGDRGIAISEPHDFFLGDSRRNPEFSTQSAVDLHGDLNFVSSRKFGVCRGPAHRRQTAGVA